MKLENVDGLLLDQLGDIYRGNGLAKLTFWQFSGGSLTEATVRAWMDGVLASEHKGVAHEDLTILVESGAIEERIVASQVLVEGFRAGAYPRLQNIYARSTKVDNEPGFMGGRPFWASFIQAMRDGAPCAQTLRALAIPGELDEKQTAELRAVLPQVKHIYAS